MDRIDHNDRLCDHHHNSPVAVTEFALLISEHLSDRVVSDVKQSPCWARVVDETTNIAPSRCPFHLPQPGQRKDFQLCTVLKPSKKNGCLTWLWMLSSMFQWMVQQDFNRGALCLCNGAWNSENWQKLHWFIVFRISIWGAGSFVWGANCTKTPHGDETESRAHQWWGCAWDCSWDLWLKWKKQIINREWHSEHERP